MAALLQVAGCAQEFSQPLIQPGTLPEPPTIGTNRTGPAPNSSSSGSPGQSSYAQSQQSVPLRTVREHWNLFVDETISPMSAAGTIFNAGFSQLTRSDPQYGMGAAAFGQRVGASAADIATQNFFGDFLVASALKEDPRYFRRGEQYRFWYRFRYSVTRAFVIRTASGGNSFNWDNILGSAMSTGLSNAYYPSASRTGGAMLIHFGTDVVDNGLVNLAPEFWPDFQRKFLKRHKHLHDAPLAADGN